MGYEIKFVSDGDLPSDWAAVRDERGRCYLFVKLTACRVFDGCVRLPAAAVRAVMGMIGLTEAVDSFALVS